MKSFREFGLSRRAYPKISSGSGPGFAYSRDRSANSPSPVETSAGKETITAVGKPTVPTAVITDVRSEKEIRKATIDNLVNSNDLGDL